jgi:hypothetical protein
MGVSWVPAGFSGRRDRPTGRPQTRRYFRHLESGANETTQLDFTLYFPRASVRARGGQRARQGSAPAEPPARPRPRPHDGRRNFRSAGTWAATYRDRKRRIAALAHDPRPMKADPLDQIRQYLSRRQSEVGILHLG